MDLIQGVYENLITSSLQEDMKQAEEEGMACRKEIIDEAESANMFAEYIGGLIKNRLGDGDLSMEEKKDFANHIIELVSKTGEDDIVDAKEMLARIMSKEESVEQKVTGSEPMRPLSGYRVSNLFTGGGSTIPMYTEIERDIYSADRISLIVSFLKLSGVNLIYDALKKFCSVPHHQLRIITTTYCGITEAKAVERLAALPNTKVMISYNTDIERLHAKAYIFERNSKMNTAYIGSSNLSKSAQTEGLEWNIRVTNVENPHIIKTALATFEQYWNSPNFEDFNIGGIEKFYEQTKKERFDSGKATILTKYSILPHQKQILDKLQVEREGGVRRNLIVAATGTGKTVISAYDYQYFMSHNERSNLLFVAHREEILKQALYTYRSILLDANFGELWVGSNRPRGRLTHLFISVQTFCSQFEANLSNLPADYYDYIVIDEAHHIAADSYRRIVQHFQSKLLIGLTATPERMDGKSLLPDFDHKISAEIRLPQALNEGLLTPFQYLCITDNTDLSGDDLMEGNKYVASKLMPKLCTDQRVGLIVDRLHHYIADETRCKALCFCATKEHAQYMARKLRESGLRADYLTSDNNERRDELNKQLGKGEINYLCVVDMFNEGVDIPEVDTVLFLRPTESLTIFLQQLGRGLRLSAGKQLLTVLDFVGQLNKKYDIASRFRSLMLRTDKSIEDQIKNGFTLLPHGCSIHMEEIAQKYVLENIKAAVYNKNRLVKELILYTHCPTISEFIESNGQDIRLLYKGEQCWTSLKREAGKCNYEEDENTKGFTKRIGTLCHVNSRLYLQFIQKVMKAQGVVNSQNKDEETYSLMLYYALFQQDIKKLGVHSISEALAWLKHYPLFVQEIMELTDYLLAHLQTKTFAIGSELPNTLEQYGCYTREEIFIIMGRQTASKRMAGSVTGVFNFENEHPNTEAFFVTLNKSDKDFSPSTQYDDYVMGKYGFHWQSQNTDKHDGNGKRFVEQRKNGKKFILFVREYKKDGFGNTCPFYCFGLVDYVRSYEDKPMNIEWRLHEPVLPQFMKSV